MMINDRYQDLLQGKVHFYWLISLIHGRGTIVADIVF